MGQVNDWAAAETGDFEWRKFIRAGLRRME
jgi:hypothetical protein